MPGKTANRPTNRRTIVLRCRGATTITLQVPVSAEETVSQPRTGLRGGATIASSMEMAVEGAQSGAPVSACETLIRRFTRPAKSCRLVAGENGDGFASLRALRLAGHHLHLLPVIRKFPAAIEAHHVSSGDRGRFAAPQFASSGNGETAMFMRTTEDQIV